MASSVLLMPLGPGAKRHGPLRRNLLEEVSLRGLSYACGERVSVTRTPNLLRSPDLWL
jgi:hypothetical protein